MKSPIAKWDRLHAGSPGPKPQAAGDKVHSRRLRTRLAGLGVVAALAAMLMPAATLAAAGDWAQFRESQAHQAHNTSELILSDTNVHALGLAWTGATGAAVNSSPAVANGVVYVGSTDGKLYAYAVGCATGGGTCTPIWTATTGGAIDSSPAASGNQIYVGSSDGKLYVFRVGCGTGGATCLPLWTATTGSAIHSSPSVDTGVVYVGSDDGKLYAFDAAGITRCSGIPKSCLPLWTATTGAAVESSAAVSLGVIYVGSNDGKLYAFGAGCSTGGGSCLPLWTATTGGAVHSSPAVLGGSVFVGSLDGKVYSFDATGVTNCSGNPKSCTPLWTAATGGPVYSSPSLGDGRVWIGSDDGKVYAFHQACGTSGGTCAPLWTGDTGAPVRSSPASAHDVLYVGSNSGSVYAFDADCALNGSACSPAWSSVIGTSVLSSPAVSNSVAYVGSSDGKLYAFDLIADHLVLSPAGATIVSGATEAYTAEGFDASNNDLGALTSLTTFSIAPVTTGVGTCTLNLCGSSIGGDYTVTGTYGAATGSTVLHVSKSGATYFALPPARVLDTRSGTGLSGHFTSQVDRTFMVATMGGVPSNAVAVTGNVTVVGQTGAGYVTVAPSLTSGVQPPTSTINFPLGDTRANGITVPLTVGGTLDAMYWTTNTADHLDLVFDVTGYFSGAIPAGATYHAFSPVRVLDSRPGTGHIGATLFHSQTKQTFAVATLASTVPVDAVAVTGNVTIVGQSRAGYVTVAPSLTSGVQPPTSTINFPAGDTRANGVTVPLNTGGTLDAMYWTASTADTVDVIFDVTGYFSAGLSGATFVAVPPARLLDTRGKPYGPIGLSLPFSSHVSRAFAVATRGGVPLDAVAVTGNLTVTAQTAAGYLYIGPNLANNPTSSTLNFPKGDNRANGVTVGLNSVDGSLAVTYVASSLSSKTSVLFDVTGYFVP